MAEDKKISELGGAAGIVGSDISVLVHDDVDYQYSFTQLLAFISLNLVVGAKISFGTVIPGNIVGNNGDIFIKTDSQQFAQKIAGSWSVVYSVSATGQLDGTVLYGTSTPPAASTGNNGDTYINTDTGVFYKKAAGAWAQTFAMASGPPGPRGNSVLNGTTDPTSGNGVNGDFYLNTTTKFIFGPKTSGVWGSGTLIKGLDGNTVLNGSTNPLNTLGKDGDFYINTGTYFIFGPKASGAWPTGVSLISTITIIEPVELPIYTNGIALPIIINNFQTSYSQFGKFPKFRAAKKVDNGDGTFTYTFYEGMTLSVLTQTATGLPNTISINVNDDGTGHLNGGTVIIISL